MEEFLNLEERDRVANHQIGDAAAGDAGNDGPHELRQNHRRMPNAPLDPGVLQVQGYAAHPRPLRPRKKRSFFTMNKKTSLLDDDQYPSETSTLLANAKRAAMLAASEEQRSEYFANYLVENMTSQNYPNGVGLPHRWGQF